MQTKDFTEITLQDFVDAGDHPGIGRAQVLQMAQAQLEQGGDLLFIVRENNWRIPKPSIQNYFYNQKLAAAPPVTPTPPAPPVVAPAIKKEEIVAKFQPTTTTPRKAPVKRTRKKK